MEEIALVPAPRVPHWLDLLQFLWRKCKINLYLQTHVMYDIAWQEEVG